MRTRHEEAEEELAEGTAEAIVEGVQPTGQGGHGGSRVDPRGREVAVGQRVDPVRRIRELGKGQDDDKERVRLVL